VSCHAITLLVHAATFGGIGLLLAAPLKQRQTQYGQFLPPVAVLVGGALALLLPVAVAATANDCAFHALYRFGGPGP
jgi:hypothetical protein